MGFATLSDIRKRWNYEIKLGLVKLVTTIYRTVTWWSLPDRF